MDCVFCKIVSKEIPAKIVFEDDNYIAFEDIDPQAPVHILVIPKKHIASLNNISEQEKDLIGGLFIVAKNIAESKGISDTGYRTVVNCNKDAGQEVFHIHMHIIGGRKMTWPPG